ncbi:testosterone 17-beta-dehydrogenase 3 isoform X1 [Xiphophorus maculatus]|uniref:testosterone 17-beta-dehydrogenase 3 isoform X1 n=1 Tax=Xiphophorus maculatus TaxID=8083 RepID=UPI000C6E54CE|nr:testosterone 17-beta-dehydrogenase 3 isoform X1 [Xiphophorus maculatus]
MDFLELIFTLLGAAVVVYYGGKLVLFSRMLFPKWCFPLSKTFFTSMGEWAVVTGASEGIGRAYAFALADRGMNVVIMSRTKAMLEKVAEEIGETTGQRVKVIVADFSEENVFRKIEEELKDLNIGVLGQTFLFFSLFHIQSIIMKDNSFSKKTSFVSPFIVNNVGVLPTFIPCKFLESEDLDKTITKVINCNVKTLCKMCKIILPGMENRNKGVIINVASGIASFPFPLYTLYAASKVFVERFSQCLQAEYKDRGIIIQAVAPFGVSTRMAGFQKTNIVTLLPEYFVQTSLQYLRAGDKINGTICHTLLAWLLQSIPLKLFYAEIVLQGLQDYVKKKTGQRESVSESKMESKNGMKK